MVDTKMFGFGEKGETVDMASVLTMLSHGGGGEIPVIRRHERVFECKTCDRRFPSFQALGGHRASHKKPRLSESAAARPKFHVCSICGLEFAIGQALGGHMRRHRVATAEGFGVVERKSNGKRVLSLDLNLAPPGDHAEHQGFGLDLRLGLGHDAFTMDCSH